MVQNEAEVSSTRPLLPHHQATIDRAVARFSEDPLYLAVLVGGSIAKHLEKETSDVDLYLVVTEEEYQRRQALRAYTLLDFEIATYPGGYVDAKYVDLKFLRDAASHGSEPTRDSFRGVYPAWSRVEGISELIAGIPVYPEAERDEKIRAFYSQFLVQMFFIGEAKKRSDPYLLYDAAVTMVLFGGRLLLAHNRRLFPCRKRLMETVSQVEDKPADFLSLAEHLLQSPSPEAANELVRSINEFREWGIDWNTALGLFTENSEFNWRTGHPPLADC